MSLKIDQHLTAQKLLPKVVRLFELSAGKIMSIEQTCLPSKGAPVFTVRGKYTSRGWTEWTQGFQFGSTILQFDATGEKQFLEIGRKNVTELMAPHVSHMGVHDHGFNNMSTYGNLWRLMREGRIPFNQQEKNLYEFALKMSGAVQASRWSSGPDGEGYIYSFNGPHSLFVDTIRSLRVLAVAHQLGHVLMVERDRRVSLLDRLIMHGRTTARFNIYYGENRDDFDIPGRTAHESIFDCNDHSYRCPNSQQGYSPFSTWMRGLAWAILGFAEELEFLRTVRPNTGKLKEAEAMFLKAAISTADFYLANSCTDGIPMWDTHAPNVWRLGNYLEKSSNPINRWEPVDSSAATIAAQGLIRLGNYLLGKGARQRGTAYRQAGFTVAHTLFAEPYLGTNTRHQGLILHSVYHRPNGWDYVAPGQKVPNGESSMWGDYHARELGLLILREAHLQAYPTFFDGSR